MAGIDPPNMDQQELERRCAASGVSARRLYPWWYRGYRAVGIPVRPPILLAWYEHLLYTGSGVAVVLALGALAWRWLLQQPPAEVLLLAPLVVIVPLLNWLRYRSIRRRIGLGPHPR